MQNNKGKTKLILKYFGFLIDQYDMKFQFQSFNECFGFYGPIYTYSFYNDVGCFTFHNIVQRGEWGWYRSRQFSNNQYDLMEKEIDQKDYLQKSYFFTSSWLKDLAVIVKKQAERSNSALGIRLTKN